MTMIEISEGKYDKMSSLVEEILSAGGKLMSCIEGLGETSYGERNRRSYRDEREEDDYHSGMRGGMRRYPNY